MKAPKTGIASASGKIPTHTWRRFRSGSSFCSDSPDFAIGGIPSLGPEFLAPYPHRHDYFEVAYFRVCGPGTHHLDFDEFPIGNHSLFFIGPGQVHYWRTPRILDGYGLLFTEDFLVSRRVDRNGPTEMSLFHSVSYSPHVVIPDAEVSEFDDLWTCMLKEFEGRREGFLEILRSYLHIVLAKSQRFIVEKEKISAPSASYALAHEFKKLVSERFIHDRGVKPYAETLGVTAGHLHDVVKTVLGKSPSQMIQGEVTTEAKRLLAHTSLSIAEIAYMLNFTDPSYFGRYFRRQADITPGEFREQRSSG